MIHIESAAGLGNQMFFYAMARALQLETGEPITIYDYHRYGNIVEAIRALDVLISPEANVRFIEKQPTDRMFYKDIAPVRSFFFSVLFHLYKNVFSVKGDLQLFHMEAALQPIWNRLGFGVATLGYIPLKRYSIPKDYILRGYFFSTKFWGSHVEEIRKEFFKPELIPEVNRALAQQIQSCNSVAVHIRLGDYVNDSKLKEVFYLCDEAYYQKAISLACRDLQDPVFFVFTNDIKSASAMQYPEKIRVVFIPEGSTAMEDLQLMAQCRHFIIANSTYSWWGQFLGQDPEKKVYAPNRWFRDDKPSDLAEAFWTEIPV